MTLVSCATFLHILRCNSASIIIINIITMISSKEYEDLYQILNTREDTLEKSTQGFLKTFSAENSNNIFRGCFSLTHLLRLNVLTKLQRLIAIFLILENYRADGIKKNPFAGVLFQIYNKSSDGYEKKFMSEIILDNKRDKYFKLKIEVLNEQAQTFAEAFKEREEMDSLEKAWIQGCPKMPLTQQSEIINVVLENSPKDRKVQIPQIPMNKDLLKEHDINCESFAANYLRPLPEFVEIIPEDFNWLSPGIIHDVSWDAASQKALKTAKVKTILAKAENTPLQIDEVVELSKLIQQYPTIFWHEFNLDSVEEIANKNPYVAGEVFFKLVNHPKFQTFLNKLLQMKLSTNSLHVMILFVSKCKLPNSIIQFYVNYSISQCLEMETNSSSEKLASLIAVFGKKCVEDLKWVDSKEIKEKVRRLAEKFPKSELIANFSSIIP